MPVTRRPAPPIEPVPVPTPDRPDPCADRKSPFATVAEAAVYLKESQRTVRELIHRKVFKLVPNSNGKEKPWRLRWSDIESHAAVQMREAA
jgi:excisionase family DNA binding protein